MRKNHNPLLFQHLEKISLATVFILIGAFVFPISACAENSTENPSPAQIPQPFQGNDNSVFTSEIIEVPTHLTNQNLAAQDKIFMAIEKRRKELLLGPEDRLLAPMENQVAHQPLPELRKITPSPQPEASKLKKNELLASRLAKSGNIRLKRAEELINQSSSVTDAILTLMTVDGFTYGEAKELFERAEITNL